MILSKQLLLLSTDID